MTSEDRGDKVPCYDVVERRKRKEGVVVVEEVPPRSITPCTHGGGQNIYILCSDTRHDSPLLYDTSSKDFSKAFLQHDNPIVDEWANR